MKTTQKTSAISLPSSGRVAIVAASWHPEIVQALIEGATAAFHKVTPKSWELDVVSAPGAYELPQAAQALARTGEYSAIVPLGCVIRGETPHFDLICQSVFLGLCAVGRKTKVAVSNGVLSVDTLEQAKARAGGSVGNKGEEAMMAALELASIVMKESHD